jgi:hypothetical protein
MLPVSPASPASAAQKYEQFLSGDNFDMYMDVWKILRNRGYRPLFQHAIIMII